MRWGQDKGKTNTKFLYLFLHPKTKICLFVVHSGASSCVENGGIKVLMAAPGTRTVLAPKMIEIGGICSGFHFFVATLPNHYDFHWCGVVSGRICPFLHTDKYFGESHEEIQQTTPWEASCFAVVVQKVLSWSKDI